MTTRLPDRYKFTSNNTGEKAMQDNIPLPFYLGAILSRCAYDPPALFMLGIITSYKTMNNDFILDTLNENLIKLGETIDTQEKFMELMSNPQNNNTFTLPTSLVLNKSLKKLERVVYSKQNIPLPISSNLHHQIKEVSDPILETSSSPIANEPSSEKTEQPPSSFDHANSPLPLSHFQSPANIVSPLDPNINKISDDTSINSEIPLSLSNESTLSSSQSVPVDSPSAPASIPDSSSAPSLAPASPSLAPASPGPAPDSPGPAPDSPGPAPDPAPELLLLIQLQAPAPDSPGPAPADSPAPDSPAPDSPAPDSPSSSSSSSSSSS